MNRIDGNSSLHSNEPQTQKKNVPPKEMEKVHELAQEYIRLKFMKRDLKIKKDKFHAHINK